MIKQIVGSYYKQIISELESNKGKPSRQFSNNYEGHKDISLNIKIPTLRRVAKDFANKHKNLSLNELLELLDLLYEEKYNEEKQLAGKLLQYYPNLKKQIKPERLNKWLSYLKGWAQVDSLCQSVFTEKDMDKNWEEWKRFIIRLSQDKNVNKRRASLVLLTAPVRKTNSDKYAKLGFDVINRLKEEKDKLITKAISWLLREMIKSHRDKVISYLHESKGSLPAIAVRETLRKIETGRK